jgi:hypothetical protein
MTGINKSGSFVAGGTGRWQIYFLLSVAIVLLQARSVFAQSNAESSKTTSHQSVKQRDGQNDFDFEIGNWKTRLRRLLNPLTGSNTWVEYEGTTIVRKVWNGRANLVELDVSGSAGRIEALSLRLYNPESRQWSLNFANVKGGVMAVPTIGEFKKGRGEFYSQEMLNGRAILVRFVISDITKDSCRFEQAFSDDGGKTWEINWIAIDTRLNENPKKNADNYNSQN